MRLKGLLIVLLAMGFAGVASACPPEPYCGDGTCDRTLSYSENCFTCPEDCRLCEVEPIPIPRTEPRKATPNHCDHCFFVGSLARFYDEMFNGYWYRYAVECGIEYNRNIPPQNLRYMCKNKEV